MDKPKTKVWKNVDQRIAAQKIFIDALEKMPVITYAVKAAGINRSTAYDWRKTDPEFSRAWDEAINTGIEVAEIEAWKRGRGIDVKTASDFILMRMLEAHKAEVYRPTQRTELTGANGAAIRIKRVGEMSDDEIKYALGDDLPQ